MGSPSNSRASRRGQNRSVAARSAPLNDVDQFISVVDPMLDRLRRVFESRGAKVLLDGSLTTHRFPVHRISADIDLVVISGIDNVADLTEALRDVVSGGSGGFPSDPKALSFHCKTISSCHEASVQARKVMAFQNGVQVGPKFKIDLKIRAIDGVPQEIPRISSDGMSGPVGIHEAVPLGHYIAGKLDRHAAKDAVDLFLVSRNLPVCSNDVLAAIKGRELFAGSHGFRNVDGQFLEEIRRHLDDLGDADELQDQLRLYEDLTPEFVLAEVDRFTEPFLTETEDVVWHPDMLEHTSTPYHGRTCSDLVPSTATNQISFDVA